MPEGPEIKKFTDMINKNYQNRILKNISILSFKKNISDMDKLIFPLKLNKVECIGKFIYFDFDKTDKKIYNSCGLDGYWTLSNESSPNIVFEFDNGNLYYCDHIGYGSFHICLDDKEHLKKISSFGCDILNINDESKKFIDIWNKKKNKKNVKTIAEELMSQDFACGCGNYIRSESLYLSKINPFKKLNELDENDIIKIYSCLKQIAWLHYDLENEKKNKILQDIEYPFNGKYFIYNNKEDKFGNKVQIKKIADRKLYFVEF